MKIKIDIKQRNLNFNKTGKIPIGGMSRRLEKPETVLCKACLEDRIEQFSFKYFGERALVDLNKTMKLSNSLNFTDKFEWLNF